MNAAWLMQGVTTVFVGNDGDGIPDRAGTVARLDEEGIGTDVGFFAGHNELRERIMGLADRGPTAAEQQKLEELLGKEMAAGALGLSTGLFYVPGSFAATEEIIALAAVAARAGGVYDTHMRSESTAGVGVTGAVREVIRIAESAGVPAHIAHLKALGSDAWGSSREIIELVDAARERGLAITADQYPYRASGTRFSSALVPQWARADSPAAMFLRFDDPDLAQRLREDMTVNLGLRGGADAMLVTAPGSEWQGMTLAEISAELETDPLEAALTVIPAGDPSIATRRPRFEPADPRSTEPSCAPVHRAQRRGSARLGADRPAPKRSRPRPRVQLRSSSLPGAGRSSRDARGRRGLRPEERAPCLA